MSAAPFRKREGGGGKPGKKVEGEMVAVVFTGKKSVGLARASWGGGGH